MVHFCQGDSKFAFGRPGLAILGFRPRRIAVRCPWMKPSLTDTLCTRCGLCCDGALFADVELAGGDEAAGLEAMGLEIEDGDGDARSLLIQPCAALKGTRCRIYEHRPGCCRTFECRLLQEVKRGVVGLEAALEKIERALELKRPNSKDQHPEKPQTSKAEWQQMVRETFL